MNDLEQFRQETRVWLEQNCPESMRTLQELAEPFDFTKGCKTMKIDSQFIHVDHDFYTMLFDLKTDPKQENPIENPQVEQEMIDHLLRLMQDNDAPAEQYQRLGLER